MTVGIVGSRGFANEDQVRAFVRTLPSHYAIVSGGAAGVDSWAEDEAKKRGITVLVHLADWKTYGKRAGMIRNVLIVNDADEVHAFWDGESRGTKHSIILAKRSKKPCTVHLPVPAVEP